MFPSYDVVIAVHLDISCVSEIHMPTNCCKSCCGCSSPKSEERNMVQSYGFLFPNSAVTYQHLFEFSHRAQYEFAGLPDSELPKGCMK